MTRRYRIGTETLELRFAGNPLVAPLTRALAHLERPDEDATPLVVYAWESEQTATTMPRPPWTNEDYREHGKIRGFFDERFQSVFQWGSHSLVMLDLERNEAIYWVGAAEQIPYFEIAAPLPGRAPWLALAPGQRAHPCEPRSEPVGAAPCSSGKPVRGSHGRHSLQPAPVSRCSPTTTAC